MKESPDKEIGKRLLYLEEKLVEITKCPDRERGTLRRSLSHIRSDLKKK